jgi:HAD superfamily hydrolase (TIGR01458 family)
MRGILFDLDGVFYVGDLAISGAAEVLEWCRQQGFPHLFLTNTTSRSREALVHKLSGFGIRIEPNRILTPPVAAMRWIESHRHEGTTLLLVPEATRREFSRLKLAEPNSEEPVKTVVLGDLGEEWDFTTYNAAFRALMQQPQPALVALGMTRYWQAEDGLRLDVGPFVAGLEYATGIKPTVMGKPSTTFFQTALEIIRCSASETLMIGDDIRGDIGGAQGAGIEGLLVRTGKFRPQDLQGKIKPIAVLDTIADLPRWWVDRYGDLEAVGEKP